MIEQKKPRGRPRKEGSDVTATYGFRLTKEQYEAVKAFVKDLKAKKN